MWIVRISDLEEDTCYEVVAFNFEELERILTFIKKFGDRLSLENVEQRWLVCGLEGLKELIDNIGPDAKDSIPDRV